MDLYTIFKANSYILRNLGKIIYPDLKRKYSRAQKKLKRKKKSNEYNKK